ncbi:hypothetical protein ACN0JD_002483 [Yersinia enterocolitica]|nr:hypothetical protein [Yersinia enterocolitica]HEB2009542.1 hypothetical protein [Yersinia enterocolitica]HEG1705815.1 hypothetical protein [Yersinia enterocolitica]
MTQMVFRHGDTKKWKGVGYDFEIISEDELDEYLDAGWFAHPDELFKSSDEPEPEPEPEAPKKTRKKAATDEPND